MPFQPVQKIDAEAEAGSHGFESDTLVGFEILLIGPNTTLAEGVTAVGNKESVSFQSIDNIDFKMHVRKSNGEGECTEGLEKRLVFAIVECVEILLESFGRVDDLQYLWRLNHPFAQSLVDGRMSKMQEETQKPCDPG